MEHLGNGEGGQQKNGAEGHHLADNQTHEIQSSESNMYHHMADHSDNHRHHSGDHSPQTIVDQSHVDDSGGGSGGNQQQIIDAHIHVITQAPHKLEHQDSGASSGQQGHSPNSHLDHSPPLHSEMQQNVVDHNVGNEKQSSHGNESLHLYGSGNSAHYLRTDWNPATIYDAGQGHNNYVVSVADHRQMSERNIGLTSAHQLGTYFVPRG